MTPSPNALADVALAFHDNHNALGVSRAHHVARRIVWKLGESERSLQIAWLAMAGEEVTHTRDHRSRAGQRAKAHTQRPITFATGTNHNKTHHPLYPVRWITFPRGKRTIASPKTMRTSVMPHFPPPLVQSGVRVGWSCVKVAIGGWGDAKNIISADGRSRIVACCVRYDRIGCTFERWPQLCRQAGCRFTGR